MDFLIIVVVLQLSYFVFDDDGFGKVAKAINTLRSQNNKSLKEENKQLRAQLARYQSLNTNELKARVETLEDIVTDEDRELEDRLRKL